VTLLLHIVLLIQTVKKFENRSIFNEVKAYKKCARFLGHPVGLPALPQFLETESKAEI